MTNNHNERIREILSAYESNGMAGKYCITVEPINGSGDYSVICNKTNRWGYETRKELVIKREDDIEAIMSHSDTLL